MLPTKKKVLIVDDSQIMRTLLLNQVKMLLDNSEIVTAFDGIDGAYKFNKELDSGFPFHLIITDFEMPNMNGVALSKYIRSKCKSCKIILHTGRHFSTLPDTSAINIVVQKEDQCRQHVLSGAIMMLLKD